MTRLFDDPARFSDDALAGFLDANARWVVGVPGVRSTGESGVSPSVPSATQPSGLDPPTVREALRVAASAITDAAAPTSSSPLRASRRQKARSCSEP